MTAAAYFYICDGDIDNPVLTHKKMDWPEKYPHWQEIPLVMAQPEQEPVAWGMPSAGEGHIVDVITPEEHDRVEGGYTVPLYTTPPQRTWVGLTEKEILECRSANHLYFYKAIEAKLKQKNGYAEEST